MSSSSFLPTSLERFLEVTTDREQTIAANMANVDTPGYKTKDVNFKQALSQASDDQSPQFSPAVMEVGGLLERPDGNNVNLDREGTLLAQSQLQFSMGTQLVKSQFHTLMSAINGGN